MTASNRTKRVQEELKKARAALASAEYLLAGGHNDAAFNRAYYCAFHAARAALASVGIQPKTHKGVNQRFNLDLVVPGHIEAEYLSLLGQAQAHREVADYSVDITLSDEDARVAVSSARRFLQRIESFLESESTG